MTITIDMLPKLPPMSEDDRAADLLRYVEFEGGTQYGLGVLFAAALDGELPEGCGDSEPTIGYPRIGPHHIMDSMARDYALLPEDLTCGTLAMDVCCVRDILPSCEECGKPAAYDIWATAHQAPSLLCEVCAEPLNGLPLGRGSATMILTFDEMPWVIRDICDNITAELGRPSLWT